MSNVIVSPSILSADFANLERDIKRVEQAGADWLHIDVMDGHFVPNITIGVPVTASIKRITELPLDVHLMIENPEKYVEPFVNAGADILTFHYEAVLPDKVQQLIEYIKSFGIKAGMSIKPKTQVEEIAKYLSMPDTAAPQDPDDKTCPGTSRAFEKSIACGRWAFTLTLCRGERREGRGKTRDR